MGGRKHTASYRPKVPPAQIWAMAVILNYFSRNASAYEMLLVFSHVDKICSGYCGREIMGKYVLSPLYLSLWPLWWFCETAWKVLGSELEERRENKKKERLITQNQEHVGEKKNWQIWIQGRVSMKQWCDIAVALNMVLWVKSIG